MATAQDTIIQKFNDLNPKVKLTYELFDFPLNDQIFTPKNAGFITAEFFKNEQKVVLNTIFEKKTGLDLIEKKLVSKVIKMLLPQK